MALFRKKPKAVEAIRWDASDAAYDTIEAWAKDAPNGPGWRGHPIGWHARNEVSIMTLEGMMTAKEGDWIIRGVKGEIYPCKPDIFIETYEPVDMAAVRMLGGPQPEDEDAT